MYVVEKNGWFNFCPSTQTREPLHGCNTTKNKKHFENIEILKMYWVMEFPVTRQ